MNDDCLFIDSDVKRDHVLSTWSRRTTHWMLNETLINKSFVLTSFRKSYLFHSLNLEACSSLIEWNRIDIVEKWIDTDQSLHLDTDQKTIKQSTKNELWLMIYSFESHRSFLLVIKSKIIFRDFFLYSTQIFIFISLFSLLRSPRTNLISRQSIL